jgi:hypothetical protein
VKRLGLLAESLGLKAHHIKFVMNEPEKFIFLQMKLSKLLDNVMIIEAGVLTLLDVINSNKPVSTLEMQNFF